MTKSTLHDAPPWSTTRSQVEVSTAGGSLMRCVRSNESTSCPPHWPSSPTPMRRSDRRGRNDLSAVHRRSADGGGRGGVGLLRPSGEASHGASEFYRMRAHITRELIIRKGLTVVAVEADWPDAARIDAHARHRRPTGPRFEAFDRFPTWMWRHKRGPANSWNGSAITTAVLLTPASGSGSTDLISTACSDRETPSSATWIGSTPKPQRSPGPGTAA